MKTVRAFILAGGLGTRLRSVVNDRPKSLAPVGREPFLEHQLRLFKAKGIQEFVFCVGYRSDQVREHFGDGRSWGVSIVYSMEEQPLGTAGALKLAETYADGTFLVLNGDTFIDLDVEQLVETHRQHCAADELCLGTLALSEVHDPSNFGLVVLSDRKQITSFQEKSTAAHPPFLVSAGAYVLQPQILDLIPAHQNTSLERDTFPRVLGGNMQLYGHQVDDLFVDIGTPEGYRRFQQYAGVAPL